MEKNLTLTLKMQLHLLASYNKYQTVSCMIQKELQYLSNLANSIGSRTYCQSLLIADRGLWYGLHLGRPFQRYLRYLSLRMWYCQVISHLILKHGIRKEQTFVLLLLVQVPLLMISKMCSILLSIPHLIPTELYSKLEEEQIGKIVNIDAATITTYKP